MCVLSNGISSMVVDVCKMPWVRAYRNWAFTHTEVFNRREAYDKEFIRIFIMNIENKNDLILIIFELSTLINWSMKWNDIFRNIRKYHHDWN